MDFRTAFLIPLVTVSILLSATIANAYDLSGKPVGDVTRWRAENGNTQLVFLGKEGRYYKLAFTRDNSRGQPGTAVIWSRKDSQTTKIVYDNRWVKYTPHDCQLTLGRCRYTERRSDGRSRKVIQLASMSNGTISYELYHTKVSPDNLIEKGTFTVDQYGYDIDRDYVRRDGKPLWGRRIGKAQSGS